MKIISPKQMTQLESEAYKEGASESDFMEEAGSGVALIVHDLIEKFNMDRYVILLCGKGNNAGDAYVAGRHLLHLDYEVKAYQLFPISECSKLCQKNHMSFLDEGGRIVDAHSIEQITFPSSGVIIDGIFGTGFHGEVSEPIAGIIRLANASFLPIIAVDIPSGLDADTGYVEGSAIVAKTTAFLGLPKTGFFLRNGWDHVGHLSYVNFGLHKKYIDEVKTEMVMLSPKMLQPLMPPLKRSRHKYQAGHVVGLSGSQNMPGAALLASKSALCSGTGIAHLLYPEGMEAELSSAPYELLKVPYVNKESGIKTILDLMDRATGIFIGPGLGLSPGVHKLLKQIIPSIQKPCVLDADALTFLAKENCPLPKKTILTPHLGEMKRLLNVDTVEINREFFKQCKEYAVNKQVTLILKGGPTYIFHPEEPIFVNPRGDPGMATAGSGDVLTGLLASLLSQGLTPLHAAMLGVYLHGVAGEWAAENLTSYCMVASDIINYFPDAFQTYNWNE